jgi:hypothetical protein
MDFEIYTIRTHISQFVQDNIYFGSLTVLFFFFFFGQQWKHKQMKGQFNEKKN